MNYVDKKIESALANYRLSFTSYGDKHENTIESLCDLGLTYIQSKDYNNARKTLIKAYKLSCKVLGKEHSITNTALNDLGISYIQLDMPQKARCCLEAAYNLTFKSLGKENLETLHTLSNLALSYLECGEPEKDLKLLNEVYQTICRVKGKDHRESLSALCDLAVAYGCTGDYITQLRIEEYLYRTQCRTISVKDRESSRIANNLAATYTNMGKHTNALFIQTRLYAVLRAGLGEKNAAVQREHAYIASLFMELDYDEMALDICDHIASVDTDLDDETIEIISDIYDYFGFYDDAEELRSRQLSSLEYFFQHNGRTKTFYRIPKRVILGILCSMQIISIKTKLILRRKTLIPILRVCLILSRQVN